MYSATRRSEVGANGIRPVDYLVFALLIISSLWLNLCHAAQTGVGSDR
ncbi:MAG: hypothetical protein SWX82_03590 [Cyanobacteriota bacterium]|nr:hypothetical protein [Cyanobacteriota bacterium]